MVPLCLRDVQSLPSGEVSVQSYATKHCIQTQNPRRASAIMRLKPCRDSPPAAVTQASALQFRVRDEPESSGDIGDSEGNGEGEASGVPPRSHGSHA